MGERSNVVVFLGPSLPLREARAVLDATYLPPVQRGDVLALLPARPVAIAIVDGRFESVPSVWHKEILTAMAQGVHVFGGASIGALRAAELADFGMVGLGQVYEWYRSGMIDADDEVAVLHGPAESHFASLSLALVDVRDACSVAAAAGVIPADAAAAIHEAARRLYYADRSWPAIFAAAEAVQDSAVLQRMADFLADYGPGLKARDARALLQHVAAFTRDGVEPHRVDYHVERSVFLERLQQEVAQVAAARVQELPDEAEALLRTGETLEVLRKKVLFRLLARWTGERIGLTVSPEETQHAVDDFRRAFGLERRADVEAWARAERVTNDMFLQVIRDGAMVEKLNRLYNHQIGADLAAQICMSTARTWMTRTPSGHPPDRA
jgi:hypothetical protein